MTHEGIDTGFTFTKGSYGPYSSEIKNALTILSNSNVLQEEAIGKMMHITIPDSFKLDKSLYTEKDMSIVNKTIDLFSRIKNTEQAEMITTVMFSYDYLLKTKKDSLVLDSEIYDYVVDWNGILLGYGRYSGGNTVYNDIPGGNGARVIELTEGEKGFKTWIRIKDGQTINHINHPADAK